MGMTESELAEMPLLMTEAEVARLLGRSSESVKRLRLSGELPYLPGRPPRIRKQDAVAWINNSIVSREQPKPPKPRTQADIEADARAWALRQRLKFPRIKRTPPSAK